MKVLGYVFIVFLILGLSQNAIAASKIKTYRNNQLGFEISYPENWEQYQSPGNSVFSIKRKSITEPSIINIGVANFTGDKNSVMREFKSNPEKIVEELRKRFPDAKMIARKETYLGGFPAYVIELQYSIKNLNININVIAIQIFCIRDRKFYVVQFETSLILFKKTFNEFRAILATFNFR